MSSEKNQTLWDAYCAAMWDTLVGSALLIVAVVGIFLLPLGAGYAVAAVVPGSDVFVTFGVVVLWTVLVTTPVVKVLEEAEGESD